MPVSENPLDPETLKQKQREWKKRENALNRATNILKQMQKTASA